jgi:hypothetical protein
VHWRSGSQASSSTSGSADAGSAAGPSTKSPASSEPPHSSSASSSIDDADESASSPSKPSTTDGHPTSGLDRETDTSPPQSAVRAQTVTLHTDATAKTVDTEASPSTETHTRTSHVTTAPTANPPVQSLALVSTLGTASRELGKTSASTTTTLVVAAQTVAAIPRGTPDQLAAEQRAAETVNTLPVQLMKLVLQFGWRATAQQQFKLVDGPDQANLDALDDAVNEYAMGAAFQQQLLNPMTPRAVTQVAPPHTWYGQDVAGSRILYDNPDTIYRFMAVNKTSSYVITGRFTGEEMPADTTFSVLTGLSGTTASVLTGRQLVLNPDGSFMITVSGSPTGPGRITSSSPPTPP